MYSTAKKIVLGSSCYNCIAASCYDCNNAGSALTDSSVSEFSADNDWKKKNVLTPTWERFISLVKPILLDYNQ